MVKKNKFYTLLEWHGYKMFRKKKPTSLRNNDKTITHEKGRYTLPCRLLTHNSGLPMVPNISYIFNAIHINSVREKF